MCELVGELSGSSIRSNTGKMESSPNGFKRQTFTTTSGRRPGSRKEVERVLSFCDYASHFDCARHSPLRGVLSPNKTKDSHRE